MVQTADANGSRREPSGRYYPGGRMGLVLVTSVLAVLLSAAASLFVPATGVLLAAIHSVGRTYGEIKDVYGEPLVEQRMPLADLRKWVPRASAECDTLMLYVVSGHSLLIATSSQGSPVYGAYRIPEFPNGRPVFYCISGVIGAGLGLLILAINFLAVTRRGSAKAIDPPGVDGRGK